MYKNRNSDIVVVLLSWMICCIIFSVIFVVTYDGLSVLSVILSVVISRMIFEVANIGIACRNDGKCIHIRTIFRKHTVQVSDIIYIAAEGGKRSYLFFEYPPMTMVKTKKVFLHDPKIDHGVEHVTYSVTLDAMFSFRVLFVIGKHSDQFVKDLRSQGVLYYGPRSICKIVK